MNKQLQDTTARLIERSQASRCQYLSQIQSAKNKGRPSRSDLGCTNLAHAYAGMPNDFKIAISKEEQPNIAIISAYNDMLSAHQPFARFPKIIKQAIAEAGATAQFAGGTPAMCDGITQGYDGMELSLFSRDVIAMSTAIALSHHMFDGVVCLGVCDKIVPGLLIGALSFGHLPTLFAPAGPMTTGIGNTEKAKTRQLFAEGKIGRDALLKSETDSYHSPGTCTFYGTANSNQMLMEFMGLHLPNAAFANPNTRIRDALTARAGKQVVAMARDSKTFKPAGEIINEKAIINGVIGLLATGGSSNHTIHLVAIARAAGIDLRWDDFAALSDIIPLLARVYPNGNADINHFQSAGGLGFIIRELLDAGLLHEDVHTIMGKGLRQYTQEPYLIDQHIQWKPAPQQPLDSDVIRPYRKPFSANGGLKLLTGNLGRAVIKVSAVAKAHRVVEAPAIIFHHQNELIDAFDAGKLEKDFIAVVRYQGPRANGMPELHKLTPHLSLLQQRGFKVALVTDGRMSGASGKVPAAIHCSPEALSGGGIGKVRAGDIIRLDADKGELVALVEASTWNTRELIAPDLSAHQFGMGRELFTGMRQHSSAADKGAVSFPHPLWD